MSKYVEILQKYWGYSAFRPLQEDIIRSVDEQKKDTLGLLPTGGGKSIIFQVPALASEGICLVVTPLIALMKDQVENLKRQGIRAVAIYSGLSRNEIDTALDNCIYGKIKFLYLSPERIDTEIFKVRVKKMKVNLIAIDESHCISQWGYDFRPSYMKINQLRELVPNVPFLALTATATPEVVDDIQNKLGFKHKNVFKKSFERKNLIYIVRKVEDKMKYLLQIVSKESSSGVVYVRSRKKTYEIAQFLRKNQISADYFHAGLTNDQKDAKQEAWKKGYTKVIVSTNAFGMGIDKSDVRFVVHIDLPDSLEAYFQEAGRGGRDEKTAYAVLLYNETDKQNLLRNFTTSFPSRETIKAVYQAICNFQQLPVGTGKGTSYDFKLEEFAGNYHFNYITILTSIKFLQHEGYLELTEEINNPSKIKFIVDRNDLYNFQVSSPKFDAFIKLILRTYEGVFSEYVKIDENILAKNAQTTRDLVYSYLVKLGNLNIINYIPQKKVPQLIFIEERIDEKSLTISHEYYEERKLRYQKKIEAVLNYANSENCRSKILLEYFGQKNAPECGNCDVCRKKNETGLGRYEFNKIKAEILEFLGEFDFSIDEIVKKLTFDEEKTIKVVQFLLDNEFIEYNKQGKLTKYS